MTFSIKPRLQGKRVLVTAAAMGIGRASVLAMADQGAHVVATDRDYASLLKSFDSISPSNGGVIETHQLGADAEVLLPGIVPKLSATPGQTRWIGPKLGAHTAEVLATLGYNDAAQAELKLRKVI